MKKFLSLLLVICTVLSLVSCQSVDLSTQTGESTQTQTETQDETQQKPSATTEEAEPETYVPVPDPLTWDDINAIPIAKPSMSVDQLRQICVDYMRLQVSFQWTPNAEMAYIIQTYDKPIDFQVGSVYGGLPYNGPAGGPSGNLYTVMQYYNSETGVLDVKSVGALNLSEIISNHCSTSAFWGWARVINTMRHYGDMTLETGFANGRMNKYHGFLPVGPYNYDGPETWYLEQGTKGVCDANGTQKMYESYAATLPADGCVTLYNKSSGGQANHVVMISKKPEVVRNADGTINGDQSFLYIMEQTSSPTAYTTPAGDQITIVGRVDNKFSFKEMLNGAYVPFTFAEFLGTDPVEAGEVTLEYQDGSDLTFDNLYAATIRANYPISNYYVTITDSTGAEVYSRSGTPAKVNSKYQEMKTVIFARLKTYFKVGNQVKIDVRLSTGEVVTVLNSSVVG